VPHPPRPRSDSRSNMEVWATAPSPLRQGISPRSVSLVDKMRTAADIGAEEMATHAGRPAAAPAAAELLPAESELSSVIPSGAQTPLLASASHIGVPEGSVGSLVEDSSEVGLTIEVSAKGASTEISSAPGADSLSGSMQRLITPPARGVATPPVRGVATPPMQRLVTPPVPEEPSQLMSKGIIEEDTSTLQETVTEGGFENEKFRMDVQKSALEKHLERHKRARERQRVIRDGRLPSPTRYAQVNDSNQFNRSRRAVSPRGSNADGSASPRRGLPHSRSSIPMGSRGNSPSRDPSPKQAKGFRWQHGTPVLSPRSEGRSTKNARLPGNILARLKQVQDTA